MKKNYVWMTTHKKVKCLDDSHLCRMAKNSTSLNEVNLVSLKPSIHLLSKNQLIMLGSVIDNWQEMNDDLSNMKREIENLSKEKVVGIGI